MVNTKILISVVIVLLIGVAAAGYQISTNTPGLLQPTTTQDQKSTDQSQVQSGGSQSGTQGGTTSGGSQSGNGGNDVKISPAQAKSIAQKSIAQEGATTGTPELITMNGKKVYVVPVIDNGKRSGEIWIDAQTGENIGGAGGAP
ncbi:PepSY domain-containing protein [Methanobacterium sp. ACI-7]|uniref:PepSY domain-containing protein n=1 Tax=unclassified Methanobacterium TaxID=2627676 RepID=UPI0039C0CCEC